MTSQYTIPTDPITGEPSKNIIKRIDDDGSEWFIPCHPDNRDYQAYLNKDKPQVEHLTEIPTGAN